MKKEATFFDISCHLWFPSHWMKGGDRLIVASDEIGIALFQAEVFEQKMREFMDTLSNNM